MTVNPSLRLTMIAIIFSVTPMALAFGATPFIEIHNKVGDVGEGEAVINGGGGNYVVTVRSDTDDVFMIKATAADAAVAGRLARLNGKHVIVKAKVLKAGDGGATLLQVLSVQPKG